MHQPDPLDRCSAKSRSTSPPTGSWRRESVSCSLHSCTRCARAFVRQGHRPRRTTDRRHLCITVEHTTPDDPTHTTTFEHAAARLWAYEIDHLDGKLYTDRMPPRAEPVPVERYRRYGHLMALRHRRSQLRLTSTFSAKAHDPDRTTRARSGSNPRGRRYAPRPTAQRADLQADSNTARCHACAQGALCGAIAFIRAYVPGSVTVAYAGGM